MENNNQQTAPLSEDTKAIITVISLFSFYPIGVVLMWMWTKWQNWVKWTITLVGCVPFVFFGLIMFFAIFSRVSNGITPLPDPMGQWDDSYDDGLMETPPSEDDAWIDPNEGSDVVVDPIEGEGTMCTMEALLCPDGSYVGREGPNCEFSPCPGE